MNGKYIVARQSSLGNFYEDCFGRTGVGAGADICWLSNIFSTVFGPQQQSLASMQQLLRAGVTWELESCELAYVKNDPS